MPDTAPETLLAEYIAVTLDTAGLGTYRGTGAAYMPAEHGILIDQDAPVTFDRYTSIRPLTTLSEGRTTRVYRVQLTHRLVETDELAAIDVARSWLNAVADVFHQRSYVPPVLGISWAEEYSRLDPFADSQSRVLTAHSFQFRGRRS